MKKIATLAASTLMLLCCAAFLSGCGGDGYKNSGIDPGTYLFEKSSCTAFIDYKVDGTGNQKFDSIQTSAEFTLKVTPKRYYWRVDKDIFTGTQYRDIEIYQFEDCSMTFEFEINGEKQTRSFYLDDKGNHEETFSFPVAPTYSLKTKCNLSAVEGAVYAPIRDDYAFDYDGMPYITKSYRGGCVLDTSCYKNQKNLTFHSSVITPEGEEVDFALDSILSERLILGLNFNTKMTGTKTICLKGAYYTRDFNQVFTSLREYFPNLEKLAIEALLDDNDACGTCAFPEKGITIYLPDTTSHFAESLKKTYFVNDVRPYSEFSEA